MIPLNAVAQAYKGVGTDFTPVYAYLVDLLDRRDDIVVPLIENGSVQLYDGFQWQVTEQGMLDLHEILVRGGF